MVDYEGFRYDELGKMIVSLHLENNTTMKNTDFKIREYGRTELAQMYSPDITPESAWRKLKEWFIFYPGLTDDLIRLGYRPGKQRIFTPAQVRLIIDAIGEP